MSYLLRAPLQWRAAPAHAARACTTLAHAAHVVHVQRAAQEQQEQQQEQQQEEPKGEPQEEPQEEAQEEAQAVLPYLLLRRKHLLATYQVLRRKRLLLVSACPLTLTNPN